MDLSILEKTLTWLFKPSIFFFRYIKHRPDIQVSLVFNGEELSGEGGPRYDFLWRKLLVIHNDSPHLARGIKLTSQFPSPFTMHDDFPTRLEADERVKLPFSIEWHEDQAPLVARFGTSSQRNMSNSLEAEILSHLEMRISCENQYGRCFHQVFRWTHGSMQSEFFKKRD